MDRFRFCGAWSLYTTRKQNCAHKIQYETGYLQWEPEKTGHCKAIKHKVHQLLLNLPLLMTKYWQESVEREKVWVIKDSIP